MTTRVVMDILRTPVDRLHEVLGLARPCRLPTESKAKPLNRWRMETDDAVILRYLYQQLHPRRHLEFGYLAGRRGIAMPTKLSSDGLDGEPSRRRTHGSG